MSKTCKYHARQLYTSWFVRVSSWQRNLVHLSICACHWGFRRINPKDCQVLSLGDTGFLQFFRVVSRDYGKPRRLQPSKGSMVVFGSHKRWDRWHFWSPNWQEKCHLYTTYSPCLLGGYIIPSPPITRTFKNPLKGRSKFGAFGLQASRATWGSGWLDPQKTYRSKHQKLRRYENLDLANL